MADWMTDVQVAVAPAELGELLAAVAGLAELAASGITGKKADRIPNSLNAYLENLELFGELAGESGYPGLQEACLLLHEMIQARRAGDTGLNKKARAVLANWPELVRRYLESAPEEGASEAIADQLRLPIWVTPLTSEESAMVQMLLLEEQQQVPQGAEQEPVSTTDDLPEPEIFAPAAAVSGQPNRKYGAPGQAEAGVDQQRLEASAAEDPWLEETSAQAWQEAPAEAGPRPEGAAEEEPRPVESASEAQQREDLEDQQHLAQSAEEERWSEAPSVQAQWREDPGEDQRRLEDATGEESWSAESVVDTQQRQHLVEDQQRPEESAAEDLSTEESLSPQASELIEILLEELPLMEAPLERLLEAEMSAEGVPEGREDACEVYADYLERYADAAEAIGFSGLQQAVSHMRENLGLLALQPRPFSPDEIDLLAAWSGCARVYLSAPRDRSACQVLIEWLQAPDWPMPLAEEEAEPLLALLQAPTPPEAEEDETIAARPETAGPDDVSLVLPEDVNTELLEALLQELPSQTETFSAAIQNLINGGSLEDVNIAQRMAHTVKGAGNTVGVFGLANLTHHLEDILVALAKQQVLPPPSLALSLMNAADCLEAMGEALNGMGEPPDNALVVLQEILDWANRIDREGIPQTDDEEEAAAPMFTPASEPEAAFGVSATPAEQGAAETASQPQPQAAAPSPASTTRIATGLIDDLLRLGGETIILSGQVNEQVRQIEERIRTMQTEFDRLQRLGADLERLIDIKDLSVDQRQQQQSAEFDSLEMDQYSELHTTSRMLVEAATDARQMGDIVFGQLQRLDTMLLTQKRLNRDTQEKVLSARMVPIRTVVPRLQRSVRQTSRLTGKPVELHISGTDTLMDGEVLNELVDPLMHVLRNAADHGIEPAEQRSAAGKPDSGNIWLDFLREGNNILVRCRDDGAGFDFAAIRRAAESRGLLAPGKAASDEELSNLLLAPNFSTRSEVTQTSGRGVGLDVVYSHVVSQGGALELKSEAGKGCTTELRLPVSLISTHALLVRVRDQVMAVADRGIERILHAGDGEQRTLGGEVVFQADEQMYPLRQLDEILQLPPDDRADQRGLMPVLLVRGRSGITAVPVQEVLAGTDLVVKEFGLYVAPPPGIVGATILGDGAVTPVLDLPELMSGTRRRVEQTEAKAASGTEPEASIQPMALVVDDSLSARRALVQVMTDAGYQVREARDGLEAVQIVQGKRPDIVLADMEMPRMNGIELTAHLRARSETADLPVIMITSRSTAKHRQQAETAGVNVYLTKPFLDDQLLDQVAALRGQL